MATAPKKPQDHARKAEAAETPVAVSFEHNGHTYTVAPDAIDNLELFEAVEDEQYLKAMRGFLGQEQWDAFKNNHRTPEGRVPMASLEGFLQTLMEAIGQGN